MSRVAKNPIKLPAGVDLNISGSQLNVKGPKGNLALDLHPNVSLDENDGEYSSRMLEIAIESLYDNPTQIIGGISSHFLQNEIGNLLVFPLRNNLHKVLFHGRAY